MSRQCFDVIDMSLSQDQLERGDYSSNFLDWRIFKLKKDGTRVKKPILATVDAKIVRDAYAPDEVINAMMTYLSSIYDSHEFLQVRSRGYLTYPSWFSALFQNERPQELPELRFRELESIASSFETEINDY